MSSVYSGCDFVAGWASGILALIVGHPLDTVKVWSQTLPGKSSPLKIISTIYKHDGFKGYYKGMMFPLVTAGALNSLYFGVYGNMLRHLQSLRGVEQTMCWFQEKPYPEWYWDILLAGCTGGLACSVITCPVELIKTQMQTQTYQQEVKLFGRSHLFKSPWECFVYQYTTNGIKGVYKGFVPLLWRDLPGCGFYVFSYEWLMCRQGQNRSETHHSAVINQMLGGAVAGVVSWATVVPFDVVKSRIQADSRSHPQYSSMWDCIVKSYHKEGVEVFFRGFWLVIVRSIPVNAVVFVGDVTASGVYMLVYCKSCQLLSEKQQLSEKDSWAVMLAGAIAGMVSWLVIVPLDVIKTRIQADDRTHAKYRGMVDCAIKSYRTEGSSVFWRGVWLIVLRSLPVNAVTFVGEAVMAPAVTLSATKDMTLSFRSRSADQRSSSRNYSRTHLVSFTLRSASFADFPHSPSAVMISGALVTAVACVCVAGMRASHYPSAPQYTWAPRQSVPPTQPPVLQRAQHYYKGSGSAPGYNSAPGFWNSGSAKGDNWSYNRLPASGSGYGGYYKNERADKLTAPTAEGQVSGKALAAGGYSRFTTNYQNPQQNRYGSFTPPRQNPPAFGNYGSYRNVGFYGMKGSYVPNHSLSGGPPLVNPQALRGSRIYEGPVGLKHNQTKKTGVYVIPTPAKLYFDGVKN